MKLKHLKTFESYSNYDNLVDYDKEPMLRGYLECAIFADIPEEYINEFGTEDIDENSIIEAQQDIKSFKEKAGDLLDGMDTETLNQVGMDFWYSRNGHGTGFWDRENLYGDETAKKLDDIAKKFPTKSIDVENGKVNIY